MLGFPALQQSLGLSPVWHRLGQLFPEVGAVVAMMEMGDFVGDDVFHGQSGGLD